MKQYFGMSQTGNLKEAAQGVHAPGLLILMSNADQFEAHVTELESLFPGVPSIGCIGMSYSTRVVEKGVGLVAFYDNVTAVANVLEQASTMPVKYIERMEQDLKNVHASSKDTVCIDLCTGNDACVLTTIHSILGKAGIPLVGGTGDGGKVSVNGTVYEDADVYAFVKNNGGKVAVYKENLYKPMPGYRFIASNTDRSRYYVGELNGKSSKQAYMDALHISESNIINQTFHNPLGKMNGQDICIISLKEVSGNGLCCYRQVNDSDVLVLLEEQDYNEDVYKRQGDRLMQSGLFLCRFYFVLISRELQRIRLRQILKPRGKRSGIRHHADAVSGAHPEITATFIADIQIFFRFLFIDLPAAGRAHNRLLQRLYCLHRCFFCRFFFPLLKQSRHFSSTPPCCRLQT